MSQTPEASDHVHEHIETIIDVVMFLSLIFIKTFSAIKKQNFFLKGAEYQISLREFKEVKSMAVDVFIAYARKDRSLLDELVKHLSSLERQGLINCWVDSDIVEGTEWRPQLLDRLRTAQVILLLISPDFIASRFCYDVEMKEALLRHEAREARVIPVILRPVEWYGLPFARIQLTPASANPVTCWLDRDAAFVDVIRRIRRSIKELQAPEERAEKEKPMSNATKEARTESRETTSGSQAGKMLEADGCGWSPSRDAPLRENPEPESEPARSSQSFEVHGVNNNSFQQGHKNTMTVTNNVGVSMNDLIRLMKELER